MALFIAVEYLVNAYTFHLMVFCLSLQPRAAVRRDKRTSIPIQVSSYFTPYLITPEQDQEDKTPNTEAIVRIKVVKAQVRYLAGWPIKSAFIVTGFLWWLKQ